MARSVKVKKRVDGNNGRVLSLVLTGFLSLVIGILLGVFTPLGEHLGHKVLWSIFDPDIEVHLQSLLISREPGQAVADVKLRIRVTSADGTPRDVQLVYVKNGGTRDSVSLVSVSPIHVESRGFALDSVYVSSVLASELVKRIPSLTNSGWELGYYISGESQLFTAKCDSTSLERLHFFLLPFPSIDFDQDQLPDSISIIGESSNLWSFDSTGWTYEGKDSSQYLLYPSSHILLGMDTNEDEMTDTLVRVSDISKWLIGREDNGICAIVPMYSHYFERISGFVVGVRHKRIAPDSVFLHLLLPESREELTRAFGGMIDSEIPLGKREFTYWQYRAF